MARLTSYLIFITTCSFVAAVYFPMNDLAVNVPLDADGGQNGFTGFTILDIKALNDHGEKLRLGDVLFKIVRSKQSDYFTLDRISGQLKLSDKFPSTYAEDKTKSIPLEIEAVERQRNTSKALLHVMISLKQLSQFVNCESLSANDICFWPSVRYEVVENKDSAMLGTPGPRFYEKICSEYNVSYRIVEGRGNVTIEKINSEWLIHTQHALERDFHPKDESEYQKRYTVGPKMNISLLCTVTGPQRMNDSIIETLNVFVRDENDNPPVPQFSLVLDTYLPTATVKKGSQLIFNEPLIIQDLDSPDVNNFSVELLDDVDHLLNLTHSVHENDHKGEVQTFLLLKLSFAKSKRITNFPYTATMRINDTTLTPGHGNSSFNVTIRIHNGPEIPPSPSSLIQLTHLKTSGILYPSLSLKLLRTAAPFARLTQPRDNANLTNIKTFSVKNDSTNIVGQKKRGAFDVTKKGGIVYVKEISMLRNAPPTLELEIEWKYKNKTTLTDIFTIQLIDEEKETCGDKGDDPNDWYTCAFYKTKKKCTDGCGLATGGSVSVLHGHTIIKRAQRCVWRSSVTNDVPIYTMKYDTCTPETTCPDQICDPLEQLHHRICPQDCTEKVLMGDINDSGRGIGAGLGVCTCSNSGDCVCGLSEQIPKEKTTASTTTTITTTTIDRVLDIATIPNGSNFQKSNKDAVEIVSSNYHLYESAINTKKADQNVRCDVMCMVGIICGGIFLLASLTGLFIICRLRKTNKLGRRDKKYINSVTALSTMQSEYFDRAGGIRTPDTLPLNFDMNISLPMSTTITMIDGKHAPDPKWEFPRSNLTLEQTLGEGEFGKVLRAKAFEIVGIPGYTTVAVKTLKDNSRTSELNDLMSEYELLKEISHPNVIRLLGACTLPGGPVYLIIEFAEHGSLRNYLRQSRHIESDSGIPNTGALLETTDTENQLNDDITRRSVPFITPKDVMSFAWQISKGMAYLGDIKLVHRDLAARNVLLATGKVCKISDFGLTRDVYEDDAYLKRSKGRVPVKWMAPESLSDHVYTNKSDIWSFGILLWELVTLGASPYPGVAVENLFHLLKSGYRMERPENCSPHLYYIMKSCWELDPSERPSFRSLTEKFEHMLEDGVEYLDLNPRIVHNRTYFVADMNTNFDSSDTSVDFVVKSYKNIPIAVSDSVNFSKQDEPVKCADSDKLPLWEPPSLVIKNQYENEIVKPTQTLVLNHYESPVKVKTKNSLLTPTNDRPQSYIDMAGNSTEQNDEEQTLLNNTNEQNTNTVTSF